MLEATTILYVEEPGQVYNQTNEFVYLGGNVNHNADRSIVVDRRIRTTVWYNVWKYKLDVSDSTSAPLELTPR